MKTQKRLARAGACYHRASPARRRRPRRPGPAATRCGRLGSRPPGRGAQRTAAAGPGGASRREQRLFRMQRFGGGEGHVPGGEEPGAPRQAEGSAVRARSSPLGQARRRRGEGVGAGLLPAGSAAAAATAAAASTALQRAPLRLLSSRPDPQQQGPLWGSSCLSAWVLDSWTRQGGCLPSRGPAFAATKAGLCIASCTSISLSQTRQPTP